MKKIIIGILSIFQLLWLYPLSAQNIDSVPYTGNIPAGRLKEILFILVAIYFVILGIYYILRSYNKQQLKKRSVHTTHRVDSLRNNSKTSKNKGSNFVINDTEAAGSQKERANRNRHIMNDSRDIFLEQERWALPGFLSIRPVIIDSSDINTPAEQYQHSYKKGTLFNHYTYRFEDLPSNGMVFSDVEAYCRSLLDATENWGFREERVTLYLINQRQEYHPILQRKGSVYISGEAIQKKMPEYIVGRLSAEIPVLDNEGHTLYLPLFSSAGNLGALAVYSSAPMFNQTHIDRAWNDIRKYGEFLYQARAYEQFTKDPVSTLYNGMQFHTDLGDTVFKRESFRQPPVLLLIKFSDGCDAENMSIPGMILRSSFPREFRLYRIACDVFAVMGPDPGESGMANLVDKYRINLSQSGRIVFSTGACVLTLDIADSDSWFRQAGLALEECSDHSDLMLVYRSQSGVLQFPRMRKVSAS